MGIQGLTARLESYASPWPTQEQSGSVTAPRPVIIDGPSLAYFIYYRHLKEQDTKLNALDAYPSYDQVTHAVLRFLGRLEASEFTIHSIYFDGRLPDNKRDTRMQRLQGNLNQLRAFRSAHPFLGAQNTSSQHEDRQHFANAPGTTASVAMPSRSMSLPALPFLVPAVIEQLLRSKYASVTSIVPGEADVFCAESARKNPGSIVLTSDSDLLVHCSEDCVVFFGDMDASGTGIRMDRCYQPAGIARTLGCADFRVLAYVMAQDSHMSASQAARMIKQEDVRLQERATHWYETEMLEPEHIRKELGDIQASYMGWALATPIKDPRMSELFYDWTLKTKSLQKTTNSNIEKPEVRMYLPFLIDDPSKASAWRLSLSLRRRAYSLLHKLLGPFTMLEIDRRGTQIQEHIVSLNDRPFEHERSFMDHQCSDTAPSSWWQQLIEEFWTCAHNESSQTPYTLETFLGLFSKNMTGTSWDVVHLKAQLEGYIYSLRLLHFVLDLCARDPGADALMRETSLWMMYHNLSCMGDRIKLGVSPNDPYPIHEASFRRQAYAWYGTTEEKEKRKAEAKTRGTGSKREARQKRLKTEQQTMRLTRRQPSKSNNLYSCLTDF